MATRARQAELKERELEETGSSIEEVRLLRAQAKALRAELDVRLRADPKTLQILRLQLRDYSTTCSQVRARLPFPPSYPSYPSYRPTVLRS